MHYRKFWKKMGFNSPLYASFAEVFFFEALLLILVLIYGRFFKIPLAEPFHEMFKWFFVKINHQPTELQIGFLMRLINYALFFGITFPAWKIIYDNLVTFLLPRVLRGPGYDED